MATAAKRGVTNSARALSQTSLEYMILSLVWRLPHHQTTTQRTQRKLGLYRSYRRSYRSGIQLDAILDPVEVLILGDCREEFAELIELKLDQHNILAENAWIGSAVIDEVAKTFSFILISKVGYVDEDFFGDVSH